MVRRDERHPGARLGALTYATGVRLGCEACGRTVVLPIDVALALWGRRGRLGWIARDIVCGACGSRRVEARPDYGRPGNAGWGEGA